MGAAFYAWDLGVKRGDIRVLGTASYVAPLLSTLILIASGVGRADWRIASACVLITGGAGEDRQRNDAEFEYSLDSPWLANLPFSAVAAFIYLFMVARPPSARRRQ